MALGGSKIIRLVGPTDLDTIVPTNAPAEFAQMRGPGQYGKEMSQDNIYHWSPANMLLPSAPRGPHAAQFAKDYPKLDKEWERIVQKVELHQGEMLLLPHLWTHEVLSKATTPQVEQPLTVAINWWTDPNLFLGAMVSLLKMNVWLKSPAWRRAGYDPNRPHINIDHTGRDTHPLYEAQRRGELPPYKDGYDLGMKATPGSKRWRSALDQRAGFLANRQIPEDAFDWWVWSGHRRGAAAGLYMSETEARHRANAPVSVVASQGSLVEDVRHVFTSTLHRSFPGVLPWEFMEEAPWIERLLHQGAQSVAVGKRKMEHLPACHCHPSLCRGKAKRARDRGALQLARRDGEIARVYTCEQRANKDPPAGPSLTRSSLPISFEGDARQPPRLAAVLLPESRPSLEVVRSRGSSSSWLGYEERERLWLQIEGRSTFILIDPLDTVAVGPTRMSHRGEDGKESQEDRFAMLDVWALYHDQEGEFPEGRLPTALSGRSRVVPLDIPGVGVLPVRVVELLPGETLVVPAFWWTAQQHLGPVGKRDEAPGVALVWSVEADATAKWMHRVIRGNVWRGRFKRS